MKNKNVNLLKLMSLTAPLAPLILPLMGYYDFSSMLGIGVLIIMVAFGVASPLFFGPGLLDINLDQKNKDSYSIDYINKHIRMVIRTCSDISVWAMFSFVAVFLFIIFAAMVFHLDVFSGPNIICK